MTGTELKTRVKAKLNDKTGAWSDNDYLNASNSSLIYCVNMRIARNDPEFVFPLAVVNGQDQPADFVRFAGTNPIEIRDLGASGRKWYYTDAVQPTVKYYRMRPLLTTLGDTIIMPYTWLECMVKIARYELELSRGTVSEQAALDKADADKLLMT
jgi:hypothetical protein